MLVVEKEQQIPPQMDLEPEMGTAAVEAAVYDTPPPHLRQIPSPTPSETATENGGAGLFSPSVITQMVEMITQAMRGEMQQMESKMNGNARQLENKMEGMEEKMEGNTKKMEANTNGMREEMKEMRGEMQCMGAGLLDGLDKLKIGNGNV